MIRIFLSVHFGQHCAHFPAAGRLQIHFCGFISSPSSLGSQLTAEPSWETASMWRWMPPTVDLSPVCSSRTRAQYEALVETNRRDVEEWYIRQVSISAHGLSGPSDPWALQARPDPVFCLLVFRLRS